MIKLVHLGLTFLDFPLGIRFCCQFPVEMHRTMISVIHPWPICALSQITPPVIWTKICGHSLNFHSCGLSYFSSSWSEMTLDWSLQSYVYVLKGFGGFFICLFVCLFWRPIHGNHFVWIPQSLRSLSQKIFFRPSGLGEHNLTMGFWDPFLSLMPTSYASMLPVKPNQLPGFAVLRMEMRDTGGHTSLPCRILELTNRPQSIAHVCQWGCWRRLFIDNQKERPCSRLRWWQLCNVILFVFVFPFINLPKMEMDTRTLKSAFASQFFYCNSV